MKRQSNNPLIDNSKPYWAWPEKQGKPGFRSKKMAYNMCSDCGTPCMGKRCYSCEAKRQMSKPQQMMRLSLCSACGAPSGANLACPYCTSPVYSRSPLGGYLGIGRLSKTPTVDPAKLEALKKAEPRKVTAPVPDYFEPLTGWRAWASLDGRLAGIGNHHIWEPKKVVEAKCTARSISFSDPWGTAEKPKHSSPQKDCTCGVWAFPSIEKLLGVMGDSYANVKVVGQVYLWGRVVECENGFRAQYAYPKELWLLDNSLEQLGYVYNVPVRTA